ncbi:MAG: AAA family ATPase [Chlamydiia bacterium]|nr:AAA family ATPase [Chlamydiia bacterium]
MNLIEIKEVVNYVIDNNQLLESKGLKSYTLCLEGEAGVGKTAIVEEIAKERGAVFIKESLAAYEEIGDLTGMPIKMYSVIKDEETILVAEGSLDVYMNNGWSIVPGVAPVMDYAIPKWVPTEEGTILLLDDYSRASPIILQATMELIDKGEMGSWKLPKNTQIILSTNPANGSYSVEEMDAAQRTRFMTFQVDFDAKVYAYHLEDVEVRDEFINFMLLYPEIFEKKSGGNGEEINARTYMAFARNLESVKDLGSKAGLVTALKVASGTFIGDSETVGTLFALFIQKKLDKLITPKKMITGNWATVVAELETLVGHAGNVSSYRADIAAVLTIRLVNYMLSELDKKGTKAAPFIKLLVNLTSHKKSILTHDLIYVAASKLYKKNPSRMKALMLSPHFRKVLIKE